MMVRFKSLANAKTKIPQMKHSHIQNMLCYPDPTCKI